MPMTTTKTTRNREKDNNNNTRATTENDDNNDDDNNKDNTEEREEPAYRRMLVAASLVGCMTMPSQDVCSRDVATVKTRMGCIVVARNMILAMHNCAHHITMMADVDCRNHLLAPAVCPLFIIQMHVDLSRTLRQLMREGELE